MSPAISRLGSPEARTSLYQFTVYLPGAVASVFLGIWLSEHGVPADQIGIINAVPMLGLLLLNMIVGRLADRADDWRTAIILISIASAIAPIGLYFVSEFWGVLLFWSLCSISNGLVPPVIDAATVRMARRNGSDFGAIRVWATVGYVVGVAGIGVAMTVWGSASFVTLYILMTVGRALLGFGLPRFRAPKAKATLAEPALQVATGTRLRDSLKLWFVLPLVAFALVNSSNALIGGFAALLWHQGGIADYYIGPLLAASAAAEAVAMFLWRRFDGKVTARNMILAACVAGLVRFTVMAFDPSVEVLFFVQMLHAFSFGIGYLGVVHFIANWTNEGNAAEAQGFATMLQTAASMVALVTFGFLVELFGPGAFYYSTVTSLIAIACVLISLKLRPPKDAVLPR